MIIRLCAFCALVCAPLAAVNVPSAVSVAYLLWLEFRFDKAALKYVFVRSNSRHFTTVRLSFLEKSGLSLKFIRDDPH